MFCDPFVHVGVCAAIGGIILVVVLLLCLYFIIKSRRRRMRRKITEGSYRPNSTERVVDEAMADTEYVSNEIIIIVKRISMYTGSQKITGQG